MCRCNLRFVQNMQRNSRGIHCEWTKHGLTFYALQSLTFSINICLSVIVTVIKSVKCIKLLSKHRREMRHEMPTMFVRTKPRQKLAIVYCIPSNLCGHSASLTSDDDAN